MFFGKNYQFKIQKIETEIEQLKKRLDNLWELNKAIEIEVEKIKVNVEHLKDKYNSLRASIGAYSRKRKELELFEKLPPEKLQELGYEVVQIKKKQQEKNENG